MFVGELNKIHYDLTFGETGEVPLVLLTGFSENGMSDVLHLG
jgi:hypothetical protein